MKTPLTVLCACLALGLAVSGCGDDDDDDGGSNAADTTADKPAGTPTDTAQKPDKPVGKKGQRVSMKDIAYTPAKLTIAKGKTVTWTNDDHVEHDVTKLSGPGGNFKSGPSGGIQPGQHYSHTFRTLGKIVYQCTVHPGMEGTVTVK